MEDIEIDGRDIRKPLKELGTYKAHDTDGVSSHTLKESAETLGRPPEMFFGDLGEESVAREWMRAKLVCIYKREERGKLLNCRTLPLTSVVSMLLDRLLKKKISERLKRKSYMR